MSRGHSLVQPASYTRPLSMLSHCWIGAGKRVMEHDTQSKRLFSLAVALVDKLVGFLGNVFFEEMGIFSDDRFQFVIEYDGDSRKIAAIAYPLGRPDGADDMGMPVLASISMDNEGKSRFECDYGIGGAL